MLKTNPPFLLKKERKNKLWGASLLIKMIQQPITTKKKQENLRCCFEDGKILPLLASAKVYVDIKVYNDFISEINIGKPFIPTQDLIPIYDKAWKKHNPQFKQLKRLSLIREIGVLIKIWIDESALGFVVIKKGKGNLILKEHHIPIIDPRYKNIKTLDKF